MSAINDPIAAASSGPSEPVQEVQVDVTKLTALSPEVISKQATVCHFPHHARSLAEKWGSLGKDEMEGLCADESFCPRGLQINIGTIGHVAHGKSSTVRAISGVQTVRFKNELERNITIKLGYANAKVCRLVWCFAMLRKRHGRRSQAR